MDGSLTDAAPTLLGVRRDQTRFPGRRDDLACRLDGDPDGFFTQDVHAAIEDFASECVVKSVRTADVRAVNFLSAVEEVGHGTV